MLASIQIYRIFNKIKTRLRQARIQNTFMKTKKIKFTLRQMLTLVRSNYSKLPFSSIICFSNSTLRISLFLSASCRFLSESMILSFRHLISSSICYICLLMSFSFNALAYSSFSFVNLFVLLNRRLLLPFHAIGYYF